MELSLAASLARLVEFALGEQRLNLLPHPWFASLIKSVSVTYRSIAIATPTANTSKIGYMKMPPCTKNFDHRIHDVHVLTSAKPNCDCRNSPSLSCVCERRSVSPMLDSSDRSSSRYNVVALRATMHFT